MALKDLKIVSFKMMNHVDYINLRPNWKDQMTGDQQLSTCPLLGQLAPPRGHRRSLLERPWWVRSMAGR